MEERLTPKQFFCAPLLSALLFGGGAAGIADIYVHIRDIVPLSARDWEPNPLERRLARWHIDGFVAVDESSYDDLRRMRQSCAQAAFLTLR